MLDSIRFQHLPFNNVGILLVAAGCRKTVGGGERLVKEESVSRFT